MRLVRSISKVVILILLTRSILVLTGWVLDISFLKSFLASGVNTKFLPPLFNFLSAVSILIVSNRRQKGESLPDVPHWQIWFVRSVSCFICAIALATILEYARGANFGIDQLAFREQIAGVTEQFPGRMSPNGALGFFFMGSTLLLHALPVPRIKIAQASALGACAIAMLALMGHAYSVNSLYSFAGLASMSFTGALWFLFLSIAAFVVVPDQGILRLLTSSKAGGTMARRLFFAVLIIPPALGSLSLAGYFARSYDPQFSVALLVIMSMIIFGAITAVLSVGIETTDIQRGEAESQVKASQQELRTLSAHVQALQEEERIRIAREIHDELGQSLTALKMDVALLRNSSKESSKIPVERLDGILALVNATIHSVQRIATELRPGVLDDLGLTAALEWQTQEFQLRTGIACSLTVRPPEVTTDPKRSTALFRIFQETLTNIARHAEARNVSILLEKVDHAIRLRITDDGKGIDPASLSRSESLGLIGMRERAHLLGGEIEISGTSHVGTVVDVRLPLGDDV